jgi:hypothetical protein
LADSIDMEQDYRSLKTRLQEQLQGNDPPAPEDVRSLVEHCDRTERKLLEVVDLLRQSRNTFRSKQIERARKILEELL